MPDLLTIKSKVKIDSKTFYEVQFLHQFDPNVFTKLINDIRKEASDKDFIFLRETKSWYINEDCYPLLYQRTKELKEIYGGNEDVARKLREALKNEN